MPEAIVLDGRTLSPDKLMAVAAGAPVVLDENARVRMRTSAAAYAERGSDRELFERRWAWLEPGADEGALVRAFVLGHCAGVGDPLPPSTVRAVIAARVNVLAAGASGCRPEAAELLLALLDRDQIPVVPSQGSVGAAGDLAPLAHIARVACGWGGEAWEGGRRVRLVAREDLRFLPNQKEALSLINGATVTAALAAIACARARRLLETAEAACALSFEVTRADLNCLSPAALRARRHPGAVDVATRVRARLDGSTLCAEGRAPDPFSIRCVPAVLGAAWDALEHVEQVVTRELNGACDNPLVLPGVGMVEAGNFHGAPVALAMDHLKVALTQVASISERRTFRMTYGQLSGLPSFLIAGNGLNNGLMLAQYTAASLVSECKVRAHPASVDTIPTVQHHEDHVSMGPIAAHGALHIAECLADVLAIELLCGAQGLDLWLEGEEGARAGLGSAEVWRAVRGRVSRWVDDRVLHTDLRALGAAVREGAFTALPGAW